VKSETENLIFVGVGNQYRRDDGVGVEIVRRLRAENIPDTKIITTTGEGAALMEIFKKHDAVFIFDAVSSGARPGEIFRFEAHHQPIPARFFNYSTHAFSLAEAVELARALKQLPAFLVVYGIEGKDFGAGEGLSKEVKLAVSKVVQRVQQEVCTARCIEDLPLPPPKLGGG
jgi:hydrogenase maturation protease